MWASPILNCEFTNFRSNLFDKARILCAAMWKYYTNFALRRAVKAFLKACLCQCVRGSKFWNGGLNEH